MLVTNVGKNFVAKQKMMLQLFDEGYELIVPDKYKWHESHRGDHDFMKKLNQANISTVIESIDRLKRPMADWVPPTPDGDTTTINASDKIYGAPDAYSENTQRKEEIKAEKLAALQAELQ